MELLTFGWKHKFTELLRETQQDLLIISPFVTENAINLLISLTEGSSINIKFLTRCKDLDFFNQASKVSAIRKLISIGAEVKARKDLHAKAYVFDGIKAIVTSANFTGGGLNHNIELGVYLEDTTHGQMFSKIQEMYRSCRKILTLEDLDLVEERLRNAPSQESGINGNRANFLDIGDESDSDSSMTIRLKERREPSQIDVLLSQIVHGGFDGSELVEELQNSNYRKISTKTYTWLCGWSHTGGAYRNSMPQVRSLCREMFGYELERFIFQDGYRYDLKEYRYNKNESRRNVINSIIIEYHENRLN